jgi:hypothetical protein
MSGPLMRCRRKHGWPSASANSSARLEAGALTVVAATLLAIESLVFIGVHAKYREITPIILSGVLGLIMVFIAYGRMVRKPIF